MNYSIVIKSIFAILVVLIAHLQWAHGIALQYALDQNMIKSIQNRNADLNQNSNHLQFGYESRVQTTTKKPNKYIRFKHTNGHKKNANKNQEDKYDSLRKYLTQFHGHYIG